MFGEESAAEFDDWAERFKDHLTVSGKNFTDQEKVTRFKLCLKDAPRALFKELSPAQTTTLDLAMSALRAKLDSPQRREIDQKDADAVQTARGRVGGTISEATEQK
uniref:PH domain-containing protein n=1 Tax=Globodera pallida TaxID=36090 RepID=A0A183CDH0_GLOPA